MVKMKSSSSEFESTFVNIKILWLRTQNTLFNIKMQFLSIFMVYNEISIDRDNEKE